MDQKMEGKPERNKVVWHSFIICRIGRRPIFVLCVFCYLYFKILRRCVFDLVLRFFGCLRASEVILDWLFRGDHIDLLF